MRRLAALVLLLLLVVASFGVPAWATHTTNAPVTFEHSGGNEWWVEARVGGPDAGRVAAVQARDTDGAWVPMEKKWWGKWAASFRIEPGHRVQFRALDGTGAVLAESCWHSHPDGIARCHDEGTFRPMYEPRGGNEWWVQVKVRADRTLAGVDARVDDGSWQPLRLRSWGDWAESIHAPTGSLVTFRARASDGSIHVSGAYHWPSGTPADKGFLAHFRPQAGNAWWVEVKVDASALLAGVDARVEGKEWQPLRLRSWGAWAATFHVPDGSLVRFRATSQQGEVATSGLYRWPGATPVGEDATEVWPREGSYVRYQTDSGEAVPGYWSETRTNLTFTYRDGRWHMACEGWNYVEYPSGNLTATRLRHTEEDFAPPRAATRAVLGENALVPILVSCYMTLLEGNITAKEPHNTTRRGMSVSSNAWRMEFEPVWPQDAVAWWNRETGLVLEWDNAMSHSWETGRLVDTDAPIGRGDAPFRPPAREAWPFTESHVRYTTQHMGEDYRAFTNLTLRFVDGFWQGVCRAHEWSRWEGDTWTTWHVPYDPILYPTDVARGESLYAPFFDACGLWGLDVVVQGQFPEDMTRKGQPHRARVWWADEPDGAPDADAWWDVTTGLLLRWENTEPWARMKGHVTDTDAPLSRW